MEFSTKNIITLLITLAISLLAYHSTSDLSLPPLQRLLQSTYITSSTRTTSVNTFCTGLTRTTLVDEDLSSQYNVFDSQMKSFFSLDGYK